jgi:PAS domain S-box-containing protein
MSFLSWLYLWAFLAYVALAVIVIRRDPWSALNWFCGGFLLCFALWAFEDIFHNYHLLISAGLARVMGNIGSIGGYSFSSFFLLFTLVLTGRQRFLRRGWIYLPIVGLPLVFNIAQWTGWGGYLLEPGRFGWMIDWSPSVWAIGFPVYYFTFAVLALILIARFGRRAAEPASRRRAAIIFWTALASLVLATLTDVVLAAVIPGRLPELGGALALIWAVGLAVGMTRYDLMPFTVQAAADEIIAAMLDALLLVKPDGSIAEVNQSARDILGYPGRELLGKPAAVLFEPAAEFETAFNRVMNEVPIGRLEFAGRNKSGVLIPLSVSARMLPRRHGVVPGSVWVLHDITLAKRAELKLRESEEQYRTVVERASFGIVIIQDRLIVYANEQAALLAGSTPGEMRGMPFAEYVHPDARHELMNRYEQRSAGQIPAATYELAFLRRDGTQMPLEVNAGAISFRGQPATMFVVRDISRRRRNEEAIRQQNEQLEQLTRALQVERQKLLSPRDSD